MECAANKVITSVIAEDERGVLYTAYSIPAACSDAHHGDRPDGCKHAALHSHRLTASRGRPAPRWCVVTDGGGTY